LKKDKEKEKGEVSRRDFLVGTGAIVTGIVGAGMLAGCGGEAETVTTTKTVSVPTTVTTTKTVGDGATATVTDTVTTTVGAGDGATVTKTVTATTTVGGDGAIPPALEPEETRVVQIQHMLAFDIKNGRIVRGRRVHYDKDFPNLQPWTLTARGKSWTVPMSSPPAAYYLAHRKRTDSPNRCLYPLQRVDWEPGGDPAKMNTQNRGISNYKRISWDEAATIIASEMKRVADTYGTEGLTDTYSGGHSEGHNVPGTHGIQGTLMQWWAMSEYGTAITTASGAATSSSGGQLGGRYVLGTDYEPKDVLKDVAENAEMILGWAADPNAKAWRYTLGIVQGMWYQWFKDLGIKLVFIVPNLNMGAGFLNDKWIPVLPRTDAALMLAIAHTWLTEDTYDQDYLDTHADEEGFNIFKAYVMGDEDGVPKTPAWASPLCGVTEWTIKALAREWVSKKTTIGYGRSGGGAVGRTIYAQNPQRIQLYLQAMQGLGGPGKHTVHQLAFGYIGSATQHASVGGVGGNSKLSAAMGADVTLPPSSERQQFPREYFEKAIFNPPVSWYSTGSQFTKLTYPMPGKSEIHLMWQTSSTFTGSRQNSFGTQRAMQSPKLECIISQNMWLEDAMVFSDIILPITSAPEQPELNSTIDTFDSMTLRTGSIIPPVGESKTDLEAVLMVADKLGFSDKITGGLSYDELIQERLKEGYDNSGIADLVSWEEIQEKDYFPQQPDPVWYDRDPAFLAFYNDPGNNPLRTPSGKLEFESQLLKENMPDDKERPPVARYILGGPASEGWTHDEDLSGDRAKDYPLLVVADTSTWKHHSMFSDVPWTREIEKVIGWDGYAYTPVWISPEDADARGIKDGDIVRVFNERGGILAGAVVNERIIPGALRCEKAGGGHHIIPGELHHGGNPNCINAYYPFSHTVYGLACTHFLAEIEKVTGNMMDEWRENYPEHFKRIRESYDAARGPYFTGWVEGGM
ncbi:molybdopterin-dependent oxidoreductase, partial [Chloroflexota bacterium]